MAIIIQSVAQNSPAHCAGIQPQDILISLNNNKIIDVLDYRFYMTDSQITVKITRNNQTLDFPINKGEYEDLGLDFETYLMDKQQRCANKCIFCFVDQLPKGLRESLYFKDDDSRMSFLTGSYVTLTNMTDSDIDRIIKMRISPINISVHTTDHQLRCTMLKSKKGGSSLAYMQRLADAKIAMNAQLVICPTINDGDYLKQSLIDLEQYYPALETIAVVPLGITEHRENLYPLTQMTESQARDNIKITNDFGDKMLAKHGTRLALVADEMYVLANLPLPDSEYYGDFGQLEDGVGVFALQKLDIGIEIENADPSNITRHISIATGVASAPLLAQFTEMFHEKFPNITVDIHAVPNKLFGSTITVAGLLCGSDIYDALKEQKLGDKLLLSTVMLRHQTDVFLDDTTVDWLAEKLNIEIEVIEVDGMAFFTAITGQDLNY